jgi:TubC N-terminal docking domain
MTAVELLAELAVRGVIVTRAGDRLLLDAPIGTLTPELKEQLRQAKAALLAALAASEDDDKADPASGLHAPNAGREPCETEVVGCGDGRASVEGVTPSIPWRSVMTTWGRERGWLAVRDPYTGEWHEIPAREAPPNWIPKRTP